MLLLRSEAYVQLQFHILASWPNQNRINTQIEGMRNILRDPLRPTGVACYSLHAQCCLPMQILSLCILEKLSLRPQGFHQLLIGGYPLDLQKLITFLRIAYCYHFNFYYSFHMCMFQILLIFCTRNFLNLSVYEQVEVFSILNNLFSYP